MPRVANEQTAQLVHMCAQWSDGWARLLGRFENAAVGSLYSLTTDRQTNSLEFVKNADDPRAKLIINEQNIGLASSSNRALSACRGKYVMRIDADDLLTAGAKMMIELLQEIRSGNHVVYPAFYEMSEDGRRLGLPVDPFIYHHVGGAIFDKKFIDELRFKEGLRNWDGLELHERMKRAGAKIGYLSKPTWDYRPSR